MLHCTAVSVYDITWRENVDNIICGERWLTTMRWKCLYRQPGLPTSPPTQRHCRHNGTMSRSYRASKHSPTQPTHADQATDWHRQAENCVTVKVCSASPTVGPLGTQRGRSGVDPEEFGESRFPENMYVWPTLKISHSFIQNCCWITPQVSLTSSRTKDLRQK